MRRVPAILLVGLLAGCAGPGSLKFGADGGVVAGSWPSETPAVVELDAVPFYPQTDFECGPAALATMLGAQGRDVPPATLVPEILSLIHISEPTRH